MIVIAPWTKSIKGRHSIPDQVAIAQAAALFEASRETEAIAGFFPDSVKTVSSRIARPGSSFSQDFDFHLARVLVGGAAHIARPGEGQ